VEIALRDRHDDRAVQRGVAQGAAARIPTNPTVTRLRRILAHPIGSLRRALGRDPYDAAVLSAAATAIAEIVRDADPARPIEFVALDGRDHVAVEAAVRSGSGVRYPGGLRRLADDRAAQADSPGIGE
jgi:hypothetical protein